MRRKTKSVVVGATAAMAGIGLSPLMTSAAPYITVANEGTPSETFGTTTTSATGYTAYLLTIHADPGEVIAAADAGSNASPLNGIYGTALLQDFVPARTPTPTPIESDTNHGTGGYALDTHFLKNDAINSPSPTEDSDNTPPPASGLSDGQFDEFGSGTYLKGVFAFTGTDASNSLDFAYVVLPNTGVATYSITVSEGVVGGTATAYPTLTGTISSAVPEPAVAGIALASAATLLVRRRRGPVIVLR
jgi:hypothetical protein